MAVVSQTHSGVQPGPPKPVSACVAVTRADIQEALGQSVAKGEEQTDDLESTCDYAGAYGQVTITIRRLAEKLNIPAEKENLVKTIPESKVRDVEGIGTRAFFLDITGAGTQLHVIRGDHEYLLVSVLGFGDAEQVSAAAKRIARKALDRL